MKTVTVPIISSDADLGEVHARIEALIDSPEGADVGDELEILTLLAERYEELNHPLPDPSDPVEAVRFAMDRLGLVAKDLVPFFGAQSRVSEFLNRRRGLTLDAIRRLHEGLGIPYECLIAPSPAQSA